MGSLGSSTLGAVRVTDAVIHEPAGRVDGLTRPPEDFRALAAGEKDGAED